MEAWVKRKLIEFDHDTSAKDLSVKIKAFMYAKIKAYPRLRQSLGLSEFQRGGLLRLKSRSGTCSLNIEKGRRSRKEEDRTCSVCDMGTDDISHLTVLRMKVNGNFWKLIYVRYVPSLQVLIS